MYEKRVERGVALLNELSPGWERKITIETLDLASGTSCVLGQLQGDFGDASKEIWGEDYNADARHHGFLLNDDKTGNYPILTAAWKAKVEELVGV